MYSIVPEAESRGGANDNDVDGLARLPAQRPNVRIRPLALPTGPALQRFLKAAATSNRSVVAVVGGLGFEGSHIVLQHLAAGYFVRAIIPEGANADFLKELPGALTRLQLIPVRDPSAEEARSKLLLAFRGVSTVIHAPSFSSHYSSTQSRSACARRTVDALKLSLDAACAPGNLITNFIYLSSELTVYDPSQHSRGLINLRSSSRKRASIPILTENDWYDVSRRSRGRRRALAFGHTVAELRLWARFGKTTMPFNIVSLVPSFTIGPILSHGHIRASSGMVLLANAANNMRLPPDFAAPVVDVRDIARVTVMLTTRPFIGGRILLSAEALTSDELVERARVFMNTRGDLQWKGSRASRAYKRSDDRGLAPIPDAVTYLKDADVAVRGRIGRKYAFSQTRANQLLGFKFTSVDQTLRDSVQSLERFNVVPKRRRKRHSTV